MRFYLTNYRLCETKKYHDDDKFVKQENEKKIKIKTKKDISINR